MKLDELTLGQLKEIQKLVGCDSAKTVKDGGIRIVILQRGWVIVGRFSQCGTECKITDGAVIRVWGTSNGLGEIAIGGPTSNTKLDKIPETKFHELGVVAMLHCVESKWESHL